MEKVLKDRQYYENLYDQWMIKNLKRFEKIWKKDDSPIHNMITELSICFKKMDSYWKREETIRERIKRDADSDVFFENCQEPFQIVRCRLCNDIMTMQLKDLDIWWYSGKKDRVLFFYKCEKCRKWRAFYNDWEEFESEDEKCEKCWMITDPKSKFEWDILTLTYSCSHCWAKYTKTEDFSIKHYEDEPITQEDIKKYWYSEDEAKKMFQSRIALNNLTELVKKFDNEDEKNNKKEKLKDIKKYNLFELENYINQSLEKTNFTNFKITKKDIEKTYMKCEFEAYSKWDTWKYQNKELDKLLTALLSNSNWRIQKNKTYEKLWVLTWIIFWYDTDEDLLKLVINK